MIPGHVPSVATPDALGVLRSAATGRPGAGAAATNGCRSSPDGSSLDVTPPADLQFALRRTAALCAGRLQRVLWIRRVLVRTQEWQWPVQPHRPFFLGARPSARAQATESAATDFPVAALPTKEREICSPVLSLQFLLRARLLSGLIARLGLRQQEEGDAQQRDRHANARRRDRDRNRGDLDQRRDAVAARHLLEEIGCEPFVLNAAAWHSLESLRHPRAGGQAEARHQGHRRDGLEARAEVEAPDADRIGNDDDG